MNKYLVIVGLLTIVLFCAGGSAAEGRQVSANFDYYDARAFNNNGVEFVAQGKNEDALKEFKKALAVDPDFDIARYNLALAYYNTGQTPEAIFEFKNLVDKSYYFVNAHYNLGTIYLRDGDYDEALKQLAIVAELEPAHAEAHFNLGFIYFKKGALPEAVNEYRKGLSIKPDSVKGRLSLAFIYEKKGLNEEALAEYSSALQLKPDYPEAQKAFSGLKAIAQINNKTGSDLADSRDYVYMGHIYYAREMYQEAVENYSKALGLKPDNPAAKAGIEKAVVKLCEEENVKKGR